MRNTDFERDPRRIALEASGRVNRLKNVYAISDRLPTATKRVICDYLLQNSISIWFNAIKRVHTHIALFLHVIRRSYNIACDSSNWWLFTDSSAG